MNSFFITALHQYGYAALWLVIFVAAVGAPISGNLLLYAAGAFAALGDFNLFILFPVAVSAAVLGDSLGYFIGWKVGNPLLVWLEKKQRWRFMSPGSLARGRTYFRRRTAWAIFISRWLIVVLGGPINWLSGTERYPYQRFLLWDVMGQALGAIIPLGIGYLFAASWSEAESLFGAISGFALALLATLVLAGILTREIRVRKRARAAKLQGVSSQQEVQGAHEEDGPECDQEQLGTDKQEQINGGEKAQPAKPIILILISRSGGGHLNLAQALSDTLSTRYTVVICDPQAAFVERRYALVSRRFVHLLTWQFAITNTKSAAWLFQKYLTLLGYKRCQQIIEQVQPHLIIVTHAMLSSAVMYVNETSARPVPLVFQLTDLERLHMTWFVEKHADAYLAPTREIFAQALEQGIEREHLYLSGRPARRQFSEVSASEREDTLAALGFDPAVLTIFLQGGAQGSAHVARLIERIVYTKLPIQIMLAAGTNKALAECYASAERVRVLPFTEAIAPYMAAADVIAGKAGASFMTEAFLLEKPFLVTTLIPGQETPNLRFLQRYNLGWVCLQADAQQELLAKLASNPCIIAEKVEDIRAYKAWNTEANQTIEPLIEHLLASSLPLKEMASKSNE